MLKIECLDYLIIGEDHVEGLKVTDTDGKTSFIKVQGLFIAIGHVPDNSVFKNLVNLDNNGYIIAGEDCQTNASGIFTAGDCRTKNVRQLTTAASDGAISALAACERINKI